jgi:pyruvate dehydrogenase E2 component (dihydrolipoamide acetyltransferase)
MESGSIAAWNLKVGDTFGPGESICSVETDKATVDFEAQDEGVIAQILVPSGSGEIKVGSPILITVEDQADVAAFASYTLIDAIGGGNIDSSVTPTPAVPSPSIAPVPVSISQRTTTISSPVAATRTNGEKLVASPLAHLLSKERGFDINDIVGTGPGGRIIAADVKEFVPSVATIATQISTKAAPIATPVASIPASAPTTISAPVIGSRYTDYPISESAKEVAARLTQSKRNVPHYYLTVDICMDELLKLRTKLNSSGKTEIGVYELMIKAAAKSMKTVPAVNGSWLDSVVRVYDSVDINVVVGSGDSLSIPVIRDCSVKGVQSISEELNEAVTATETAPSSSSLGTFTIINLGMYGVKSCAPIIREPQSCALAIGTLENRIVPAADDDAELPYQQSVMVTCTMSCDHRVVDGAVGAQWLSTFKTHLENPTTLLL